MQHGFQRLVLLGSAGYSRAELPLGWRGLPRGT
jgi:hypothetical protein